MLMKAHPFFVVGIGLWTGLTPVAVVGFALANDTAKSRFGVEGSIVFATPWACTLMLWRPGIPFGEKMG